MTDQQKQDVEELHDNNDHDISGWDEPSDEVCITFVNKIRKGCNPFVYLLVSCVIIACIFIVCESLTHFNPEIKQPVNPSIETRGTYFPLSVVMTEPCGPPLPINVPAMPDTWSPISTTDFMRISCYDRTGYNTASGLSIDQALWLAESRGADGICAVSPDTRYYSGRKVDPYQTISVEGHGVYMVVDCTARRIHNTIDIFVDGCNSNRSLLFQDWNRAVWEVER